MSPESGQILTISGNRTSAVAAIFTTIHRIIPGLALPPAQDAEGRLKKMKNIFFAHPIETGLSASAAPSQRMKAATLASRGLGVVLTFLVTVALPFTSWAQTTSSP